MFSLKSGKVYVGLVVSLPANLEGRCPWLTITPYLSGYRDKDTKKVTFVTNYSEIIEKFTERDSDPDDNFNLTEIMFHRTIRVDDIEVCGIFHPEVWQHFQAPAGGGDSKELVED